MGSAIALLLTLFKALPALEALARAAVAESDKRREREAAQRLAAKDAAVDAAIQSALDHENSDAPKA